MYYTHTCENNVKLSLKYIKGLCKQRMKILIGIRHVLSSPTNNPYQT